MFNYPIKVSMFWSLNKWHGVIFHISETLQIKYQPKYHYEWYLMVFLRRTDSNSWPFLIWFLIPTQHWFGIWDIWKYCELKLELYLHNFNFRQCSLKNGDVCDALPSHGVKPTWRFHKVKLRKVETWRHALGFQL
jgi:hypothetical protein